MHCRMFTASATLPDDPPTLQLILRAALAEIEPLQLLLAGLRRNRFGRRPEQLDDEQLQQGIEDLEQSVVDQQAGLDAAAAAVEPSKPEPGAAPDPPRAKPKRNRGALPAHLPRIGLIVDVEDKACPCCGGAMHVIGEDRAEMLDYVPAQLRVKVIRRPRHGWRACEGAVVQAPAPERPVDGGMAGWRDGERGTAGACADQQIPRSPAAVSSGPDLRPRGRDARSFHIV